MSVSFQIPRLLQRYCGGRGELSIDASNVAKALTKVRKDYPELYVNICDETGKVRQHINLFVNETIVDKESLEKASLKSGDDLLVFTAVSGG